MLLGIDGHFVDGEKHVCDAVLRAVGRQVAFKVAEGPAKFYREFDGKPQKFHTSAERHSKKNAA